MFQPSKKAWYIVVLIYKFSIYQSMKVKLSEAVKLFFNNSSLEMIFFEAIANALDATASEISIRISINKNYEPNSLKFTIEDNGVGFTDDRFNKFSKLFDVEEKSHKGLGRLVYLCYFKNIEVESYYDRTKYRKFLFSEEFDENDCDIIEIEDRDSQTKFTMENYAMQKIAKIDYIKPLKIKKRILEEFYPRLYGIKKDNKKLQIDITLDIDGEISNSQKIDVSEIPQFEMIEFKSDFDMFESFQLFYSLKQIDNYEPSLISAISVDNRSFKVDIIADENIPKNYELIFLMYSNYFEGKIDATRQNLTISNPELKQIKALFRNKVAELIENKIPSIKERNISTKKNLLNRYPHLNGYFDLKNIGYISRNDILKEAQDQFFKAQKSLLDANNLSDEQYELSIELSSRALTEYVLFRQMIIDKLKSLKNGDSEAKIHNLIVPQYKKLEKSNLNKDLYLNNAWVLDDKYMTYDTILSDIEIEKLISEITKEENSGKGNNGKPDLSFIFSNDPKKEKVDVVIVEIKKKGIPIEKAMIAETQLRKRANLLMKYYDNNIQRIWFYGIIEINEEVERHLRAEYKPLYSTGKTFYKSTSVVTQLEPEIKLPIGIFMMDLKTMIDDAESRNKTFLELIKSKFIIEE